MAREYKSAAVKEAETAWDELDPYICEEHIGLWFAAHSKPSPTMFALDFGIGPADLKVAAAEEPLVNLALYRIIGVAESQMFDKVYSPLNVIKRVELFLDVKSVSDADANGEDSGLFVASGSAG